MPDHSYIIEGLRHLATPVDALTPDPANARLHSDRNIGSIRASLARFGQRKPVVCQRRGGTLIVRAGNGTLAAARQLGWSHVAAVEVEESDVSATGYAIADNRTGELASWDHGVLEATLDSLAAEGVDLDELAFTPADLDEIAAEAQAAVDALSDPDSAEVVEDEPPSEVDEADVVTQRGDVWVCGEHRVMCGDATSADDVARLLLGAEPPTVVYDPPWDHEPIDGIVVRARAAASVLAFADGQRLADVVDLYGAPTWLFGWDCVSCWYTPSRPLRRLKVCAWYGDVSTYDYEGAHYGTPDEARAVWNSRGSYEYTPDPRGKHLADLFSAPITRLHSEDDEVTHSHSKPVDWMRLLIGCCTRGDMLDPFLGSGTTLVAAEQLGRRCFGMEIHPPYVEMAVRRWERLTGRTAERLPGGESDG